MLDISTGDKDLQQCADAVMRLRAEYLFSIHQYEKIIFYDNEGTAYRFNSPYTKTHLLSYLQQVFGMCGTASLSKQLIKTTLNDIKPGDVLIRGGFPGHAATVVDVAINAAGQKAYMIAQGYMPAQDIHILLNPAKENDPWYFVNDEDEILTPEYLFTKNELKKW